MRDEQPDYSALLKSSMQRYGKVARGVHQSKVLKNHRKRRDRVMRLQSSGANVDGMKLRRGPTA
jgi:hypothetical protein